jgi:hypothetical protein
MKRLKRYNEFLINEAKDENLRAKLVEMGVTDEDELNKQVQLAKTGYLGMYLQQNGEKFTFGILKAIFKDAIVAKRKTEIKRGIFNILPSLIPVALAPFFPILAIVGSIFGASRMFHKVFNPIFDYISPSSKYSNFLKRMIDAYMKIPEGEVPLKDRFTRAFVVSDRLVDAIKPEVLDKFSTSLSEKMEIMDDSIEVPEHYIENELKMFLNNNFDVNPEIPLKN